MRSTPRLLRTALLAFVALFATGCARGIEINSEPGNVYAIQVTNSLSQAMIVSYDDGGSTRTLGTVRASSSERFVIAAPATRRITVRARNEAGTRSAGPYSVDLIAGQTTPVRLQ